MEGNEDGVRPDRRGDTNLEGGCAPARPQSQRLTLTQVVKVCQRRVYFSEGLRRRFPQRSDAAGLCAGLVMGGDAARRQIERVVGIRLFRWWSKAHHVEARAAIGRRKAVGEEAGRPWVLGARAGPEDAVLAGDFLIADAVVVGQTAGTGAA